MTTLFVLSYTNVSLWKVISNEHCHKMKAGVLVV